MLLVNCDPMDIMSQSTKKTKLTRRQQQKDETRRLIQNAAYNLFEEKGYHATTMRKLASRAGVGLGTIFKHFPDKPSLLAATFVEDVGAVIDKALDSVPTSGITLQLAHVIRSLYQFYALKPSLSQTLCKEAFFLSGKGGRMIEALTDSLLQHISDLITLAIDRKELSTELNVNDATMAFWAFYSTGLGIGLKAETFDVDACVEMVERLLSQYLQSPKKEVM
jgi:AcrR family transcriptional regulator